MSFEPDHDVLDTPAAIEALASVAHERWAHWQRYLHDNCEPGPDGALIIPATLVRRWERQIATPYQDLDQHERESDREQAVEYLNSLRELRAKFTAE